MSMKLITIKTETFSMIPKILKSATFIVSCSTLQTLVHIRQTGQSCIESYHSFIYQVDFSGFHYDYYFVSIHLAFFSLDVDNDKFTVFLKNKSY